MRSLKRDIRKVDIILVSLLFLFVLLVWVPESAVGAHDRVSELVTPVTGTVQATPTEDATMTALNKEQSTLQVKQLQLQNDRSIAAWLWNSSGVLGTTLAALLAVTGVLVTAVINFGQWKKTQTDAQDKDRIARQDAQDKDRIARQDAQDKDLKDKAEERFKTASTALGTEKESIQVVGAILLRSFLNKDDKKSYERYYPQIFDLAAAFLRLPRTSKQPEDPDGLSHSPEDPDTPLPPTALSQALIMVFKEVFPLTRSQNQGSPQSLDATGVQLDNAYLERADLKQVWMPNAFLQHADLIGADLSEANLRETNFNGAYLSQIHLNKSDLSWATFVEAYTGPRNLDTGRG